MRTATTRRQVHVSKQLLGEPPPSCVAARSPPCSLLPSRACITRLSCGPVAPVPSPVVDPFRISAIPRCISLSIISCRSGPLRRRSLTWFLGDPPRGQTCGPSLWSEWFRHSLAVGILACCLSNVRGSYVVHWARRISTAITVAFGEHLAEQANHGPDAGRKMYSLICIAFCNCTLVLRELGDPGEFARARRGANKSPTSPRFSPAPNVSCFILLQMRSISRRSLPHKFQIMSSRTFEIILQGRRSPRSRRRPLRVDRRRARS